jgi:hypothetical protein
MRALLTSLIVCLGLILLWLWFSPTSEVRYNVKLAVRDGSLVYSNSSVWSLKNTEYELLQAIGLPFSDIVFQGEAVPVKIPGKGLILMLPLGVGGDSSVASSLVFDMFNIRQLKTHSFDDLMQKAAALPVGASRRIICDYGDVGKITAETKQARVRGREAATGQNTNWRPQDYATPPMPQGCFVFVQMSNPRLARTFQTLEPNKAGRLGNTVLALDRLDVSITDKPVTHRIHRYLPWLDSLGSAEHFVTLQAMPDGSNRSTISNGMPGEIAYLRRSR